MFGNKSLYFCCRRFAPRRLPHSRGYNDAQESRFLCVGIYPVGSLVLLESGRLGVVVEPHETSLLTPKVNIFFNTKSQTYLRPQTLDLSRGLGAGGADKIVRHEDPARWNVEPMKFLALADT